MINAFIPRAPRDKEPYIKVYGEKVLEAIRKKKLKASEFEVFLWFIGKSSQKNYWNNEWIIVDYEELAKELGVTSRTIRTAIKTLLKLKFIIQLKPRKTVFKLNPDFCFRGGVISKNKTKEEIREKQIEKEDFEQFIENATKSIEESNS
jgi:hypothetical protein